MSLHIAFCHIAVSHKIEHAGEDEFDLEALEEAKIRKLKMLASLKIIRKAQMIDDAGRFIPLYEYISYPKPQSLNLFLPFFQNIN